MNIGMNTRNKFSRCLDENLENLKKEFLEMSRHLTEYTQAYERTKKNMVLLSDEEMKALLGFHNPLEIIADFHKFTGLEIFDLNHAQSEVFEDGAFGDYFSLNNQYDDLEYEEYIEDDDLDDDDDDDFDDDDIDDSCTLKDDTIYVYLNGETMAISLESLLEVYGKLNGGLDL